MVCRTEVDGEMSDDNFWFEDFDDAYEWQKHFMKTIEPLEIDMTTMYGYNQGFVMEFEINIRLKVYEDANFLETSGDNTEVISELVKNYLYDIDDAKVIECEVTYDK